MRKQRLKPSLKNRRTEVFSGEVAHFGTRASWISILWEVTSWRVQIEHS
jgi:hypothetical protein